MNEIEYRLQKIPPINEDPQDAVFEKIPLPQQVPYQYVSYMAFKTVTYHNDFFLRLIQYLFLL